MAKVILTGFILVPEQELALVKHALVEHQRLTRLEAGCICFQVIENPDNHCRFDVYEEFTDKAAFNAHQARVQASDWGKVTANVERHYQLIE